MNPRDSLITCIAALAMVAAGWGICWFLTALAHGVFSVLHAVAAVVGGFVAFLFTYLEGFDGLGDTE